MAYKVGDKFQAKDGSGSFVINQITRIGAKGIITNSLGKVTNGYATYNQLETEKYYRF